MRRRGRWKGGAPATGRAGAKFKRWRRTRLARFSQAGNGHEPERLHLGSERHRRMWPRLKTAQRPPGQASPGCSRIPALPVPARLHSPSPVAGGAGANTARRGLAAAAEFRHRRCRLDFGRRRQLQAALTPGQARPGRCSQIPALPVPARLHSPSPAAGGAGANSAGRMQATEGGVLARSVAASSRGNRTTTGRHHRRERRRGSAGSSPGLTLIHASIQRIAWARLPAVHSNSRPCQRRTCLHFPSWRGCT